MRVAVETHGCRLNQAESDAIAEQLRARGHELVEDLERAELYLLNSCAITHRADADARAALRRARRRNPELRAVITGCHANAEAETLAAMAEVDAVIGNVEKQRQGIVELLEGVRGRGATPALVAVEGLTRKLRREPWELPAAVEPGRTRPLLKVQDGCDYQCSFCIVPSVRGRSRSLDALALAGQLRALVDAGHPEVVLTGAHLGLWGRDLERVADGGDARGSARRRTLADLIAALRAAVPEARLRLGSVDPHEVDDGLIAALAAGVDASGAGLCRYLHLPVQSGDDGVLRAMRRAHRVADFETLVPRLRALAPGIGLGVDVIVGFPGEDDAAFEATLELLTRLEISFAHVFTWSARAGTAAVELGDRVSPEVAAARSQALRERVACSRRRELEARVGQITSAVILRRRARRSGALVALSEDHSKLLIDSSGGKDGSDALLGRRAWVRVEGVVAGQLRASLLDVSEQRDASVPRLGGRDLPLPTS
ncbi:MiaB/RimO family radical SAM methylthiotransferase [Pseudenhygromyxa sp. WMMC2535]|uniref:MiaB/RimO family radical SAM methylthiotransferase n=1 Tax=Pseudenhygromyxa sp. WMMC2535 TaxID=2712867 RepID=UPI0015551E5A|nr:MiaB/RimO family radical SAM methylthiotransferase [Pseudenhygromyxa sp. WMMC2535]NVB42333.1 MiaB/RimO family radical SAM methylthiotransferase [Pseudenhygromyxa sp. WMMC2535]